MAVLKIFIMLHEELVNQNKDEFLTLVKAYSCLLNIKPFWLMQVMYKESRLNPKAVNPYTSATGLIQFMPETAKSLGTTIEGLAKMENVRQLYYVYLYLKPYKNKMKSFGDVYLAVFYPAAIGKTDDYLLPESVTRQNRALDKDHSGRISKKEIITWASRGM